jgi:hypothetical protein
MHVSRPKQNSGLGGFGADAASRAGGATALAPHPATRSTRISRLHSAVMRQSRLRCSVGDDAEARIAPGTSVGSVAVRAAQKRLG